MNKMRKVWADIQKGQNIDLLLTIVVSFALVIVNLLGVTSPNLTSSLTLAVLGLIALSSLESRYKSEELLNRIEHAKGSFFQNSFPPQIKQDIKDAKELWLIGVSLSRTVKSYYSDIEQKLRNEYSVRVILTHPAGASLEMSVLPVYGNKSLEQRKAEILGSLETLCDLQKKYPHLQIKTSGHYIGHGVIAINPNDNKGKLYIENHPFKMPGGSRPKFVLEAKDGEWYDFYKQEMFVVWDNCSNWVCEEPANPALS